MRQPTAGLRVRLHQTSPVRLDPTANLEAVRTALLDGEPADLHLFPELSLTGYDLGARARDFALVDGAEPPGALVDPSGGTVVTGFPLEDADGRLFNAAGAVRDGRWTALHRKVHLPTYGMFDEGRIFAPGRRAPPVFDVAGWRVGLLICEDLWHPTLAWFTALAGADLIVCLSAAPGRGLEGSGADDDDPGSGFGSAGAWRHLARATALQHGCWFALCNRVGIEGGVTFAGGSLVCAPDGRLTTVLGDRDPERADVTLHHAEVATSRRPFSHLRDENPAWVRAELDRMLREGG